jgi:hypothetical protein
MNRLVDCRGNRKPALSRHILEAVAALAAATVMVACWGLSRSTQPPVPELTKPWPNAAAFPPPKGIELIAEASGNILMVTVINHTDKPVLIGPKMFAVFVDGKLHPADGKNVTSRFLVKTLRREEGVSGAFQFRDLPSVEGQKLVLNSPDAEKQFMTIKRYEPRLPNYQTTERPLTWGESRRLQREQENLRQKLLEELRKRQQPK